MVNSFSRSAAMEAKVWLRVPLGHSPAFRPRWARIHSFMLLLTHRKLGFVNSDFEGWLDQIRDHIENGTNFLLILRNEPKALKDFCNSFGLPDDCTAHVITQAEFFLMCQYVDRASFDAILHHWDDNRQLVFVEQIDFPLNRPPRLQNFIVYSSILGILAQHKRLSGAKEILEDYEDEIAQGVPNPEAGVYHWHRGKWHLFEGR